MKELTLKRKENFDSSVLQYKSVLESDYSIFIDEDTIIRDFESGEIVVVYLKLTDDLSELRNSVVNLKYAKGRRTAGLKTQDKVFGYMQRLGVANDYCSTAVFAKSNPKEHNIVCNFGSTLSKLYEKYVPEVYKKHQQIVFDRVKPQWIIKDSVFTSGIINKNNQLNYHFDRGNFKNVYSNMIAFKKDMMGGHLSIPEYDLGLKISDSSVTLFDGQKILHGVTPLKFLSEKSYRYTLVYYSLEQMWKCETPQEELLRVKKLKTESARKRIRHMNGNFTDDEMNKFKKVIK